MVRISRVLCPTDFSDASRHALEQATVVARWYGAPLTLLHVNTQIVPPVPRVAMPRYSPELLFGPDDRRRLSEEAEQFAQPARDVGVAVDVVIEAGPVVAQILSVATARESDLIVMGTHGASGFEHLVLGSVTEKVLRKAPCPVMTVPPRARNTSKALFGRILAAVDFSDTSLAALSLAFSFAQEADATLTLLHVVDWPEATPSSVAPIDGVFDLDGYRRTLEAEALERLESLVPAEARQWCTPSTVVAHGRTHREIVARAEASDLIVLGARGRSALDLLLFGSTANQVVRLATCPVLTVNR